MKKIFLFISSAYLLCNVGLALTETKFVQGVNVNEGWYDVNKTFNGSDDNLCWAASISNVINWWQRTQPTIPLGTPSGIATANYSSDIFQTFVDSFVNDGEDEKVGFNWWLTGKTDYELKPGAHSAGFWKDIYPDSSPFINFFDLNNIQAETNSFTAFNSEVIRNVDLGYAMTMGIYSGEGGEEGAHAITMWGYEIDSETGNIASIYISDSDDVDSTTPQPHMEKKMSQYSLSYNETTNKIMLGGDFEGWYVGDITFIKGGVSIPESSTCTLLLAGMTFIIFRRKI